MFMLFGRGPQGEQGEQGEQGIQGEQGEQGVTGDSAYIQEVLVTDCTKQSTSYTIPKDDTIPQNTEGKEFLTVDITPTSEDSLLEVFVLFQAHTNTPARYVIVALFKDDETDCLRANMDYVSDDDSCCIVPIEYSMLAGTTDEITFKVRAGTDAGGMLYNNGDVSGRYLGGKMCTMLRVREYLPSE